MSFQKKKKKKTVYASTAAGLVLLLPILARIRSLKIDDLTMIIDLSSAGACTVPPSRDRETKIG